jgi:hypothetical protein
MRMMLKITFPATATNRAMKDGSFAKIVEATLNRLNPEAAYFIANDGCRSGILFFDMQDSSEIPSIVEPLFMGLEAEIELQPAMNADDLMKGMSAVRQVA